MPEIKTPTTKHTQPIPRHPANEPPLPESLYHCPEHFPIPKDGLDLVETLESLLTRATGVLSLIVKENNYTVAAAGAVHGMIEQSTRVLEQWYEASTKPIREQEVG